VYVGILVIAGLMWRLVHPLRKIIAPMQSAKSIATIISPQVRKVVRFLFFILFYCMEYSLAFMMMGLDSGDVCVYNGLVCVACGGVTIMERSLLVAPPFFSFFFCKQTPPLQQKKSNRMTAFWCLFPKNQANWLLFYAYYGYF